jgi:glutamate-ammonia-ligase adenylyltransferase
MPPSLDDASVGTRRSEPLAFLSEFPPGAADRIRALLSASADRSGAERYLAEFHARHPHLLSQIAATRPRLQWLITMFGFSRFLAEELLQHPDWLNDVPDVYRVLTVSDYMERLAWFLAERSTGGVSALDLALFRRREIFRIAVRDALNFGTLSEITEELSSLADAILQKALNAVFDELAKRYGRPALIAVGDTHSTGFCVLALGKLGGRELNYSSDIDLLFLYSVNGETSGSDPITNREFYKKLGNRLTEILSTYTAEGLCYRVDLRLRPEGSLGEICISIEGAKDYYAKRARDWELQMLIKARAAAGDRALGRLLLDFVEPSIYSTSTDFSAIETMSATRVRIGEKLRAKRDSHGGLNVKLARGGIRDIEFLVQCLQRLYGGREVWVRQGGTLLGLSRLLDKDLLSSTEYSQLVNAYQFLRHLEHRLQIEEDRQTHTLPSNPAELDRLARRMPTGLQSAAPSTPSAQLLHDLNLHLEHVQTIYDRIVHAQRPLTYGPALPAGDAPAPPPDSPSLHRDESDGNVLSQTLLRSVEQIAPSLVERLLKYPLRRNQRDFEHFLERVLEEPEWLRLIDTHAVLVEYTCQLFEVSPYFAGQIVRDLSLLNAVKEVADHPDRHVSFEDLAPALNDLGGLRKFFRREMLRIQTASICVPEPVFQTLDRTSALAEFVIRRAYRIALDRALNRARERVSADSPFDDPQGEMMVIALGRLGMREFDLGSDADLLFIIPDVEVDRQKFWTRVAEHVIDILTAYTGDGTILSIDTRLRPNGREGMLVQSESTYTDYFAHHSEAWEGIAYMKARAVAGDMERATNFLTGLQQADWRRWGQSGRSKQDLRQMRLRLEREQGSANPLKAGRGGYYDADFALMFLRLKGAGLFFKTLNTPERIDIVEKMGHLERADAEFLMRATTFYRAAEHGLRLATGHAEGTLPTSRFELDMLTELVDRWTTQYPRSGTLETELSTLQNSMRQLFDRLFS